MPGPTAFNGPVHFPQKRATLGASGGGTYDAPSMALGGYGVQDTRYGFGGATGSAPGILGWFNAGAIKVSGTVPSALGVAKIAAAQTVTSGTAMTLAGASTGITVLAAANFSYPFENYIPIGTLVIDGLPTIQQLGDAFTAFYLPGIARCLTVTAAAGAVGGNIKLSGADFYGQALTDTVTAVAGTTVTSAKAFKYFYSATPAFTDATYNYSIGTSDTYGLNIAADHVADVRMYWANAEVSAPTFVAADGTSPATSTTGDVRGTVQAPSASDGTKRLDLWVFPGSRVLLSSTMQIGYFGQTNA